MPGKLSLYWESGSYLWLWLQMARSMVALMALVRKVHLYEMLNGLAQTVEEWVQLIFSASYFWCTMYRLLIYSSWSNTTFYGRLWIHGLWFTWTLLCAVQERPSLNLISHSLQHNMILHTAQQKRNIDKIFELTKHSPCFTLTDILWGIFLNFIKGVRMEIMRAHCIIFQDFGPSASPARQGPECTDRGGGSARPRGCYDRCPLGTRHGHYLYMFGPGPEVPDLCRQPHCEYCHIAWSRYNTVQADDKYW